jgi:hypothetical protein
MPDPVLRRDIAALAALKIYFGHQSVGQNIIDALSALALDHDVRTLRFVPLGMVPSGARGWFADSRIGRNHYPLRKCAEFADALLGLRGAPPDIAFMKFCYSDIARHTSVREVFGGYCDTMNRLKAAMPEVCFVHVTVPLTVGSRGFRKTLNALLGRPGNLALGNMRRCEFNDLLRASFGADPVFDLAAVQSTSPARAGGAGRPVTFHRGPGSYSMMYDGYATADGSHLNSEGARAAAAELVRVLARAAARMTAR